MRLTIIVKDERVKEVYSEDKNVCIDVIDLDTQVPEELEKLEEEVKKVEKEQHCVW